MSTGDPTFYCHKCDMVYIGNSCPVHGDSIVRKNYVNKPEQYTKEFFFPNPYHYPTEEELDVIRNWEKCSLSGYEELFDYIESLWWMPDRGYKKINRREYELITSGWSGNEEIIYAFKKAMCGVLWSCCWEESKRGGYFKFDVLVSDSEEQ